MDLLQECLQFRFLDTGMPEAVTNFHKTIDATLEGNLFHKLKEYHRRHHQMGYIPKRCRVTSAVPYPTQLDERSVQLGCL